MKLLGSRERARTPNERRRRLLLASAAMLATPMVCLAQARANVRRLGILASGTFEPRLREAVLSRLRELGWTEGGNLEVEVRGAEGHNERLPVLAQELAQRVDLIFTGGSPFTLEAAKKASRTVPIVFAGGYSDNVAAGIIQSLARPGGNITGVTFTSAELPGKRLQLLKEVLPRLTRVGLLTEDFTGVSAQAVTGAPSGVPVGLLEMANALELKLEVIYARAPSDFEAAVREAKRLKVGALYVQGLPLFAGEHSARLAALATKYGLPTVANWNFMADAGFLMGYSPRVDELYRSAAVYIDKIFRGADPGQLPVEQPNRNFLVVNLKTAKALKIAIPQSILLRAERVIE